MKVLTLFSCLEQFSLVRDYDISIYSTPQGVGMLAVYKLWSPAVPHLSNDSETARVNFVGCDPIYTVISVYCIG
jgi:hypothetical protein